MKKFAVGYIYCVTNKVNGKKYVGQTLKSVKVRWRGHCKAARAGSMCALHCAIRKYGEDNFVIEILHRCTEPLLNAVERYFVALLNTVSPGGYNLTFGGDGVRASKRTRKRMSDSIKAAYVKDPTLRERAGGSTKGRVVSAETRALASANTIAQWKKPGARKILSAIIKASHSTLEARALASANTTALMADPVRRANLSKKATLQFSSEVARKDLSQKAIVRYKKHPELRALIGENSRARWADKTERAKLMRGLRKVWRTKEHSKVCSEAQRKRFSDPEERARASASKKAAWATTPDWRKDEIRKINRQAANRPGVKERNRQAQLRRYALHPYTEEQRKQRSISATKDWERRRQESACKK